MKIYTIGLEDSFSPIEVMVPNVREDLSDMVPLRITDKKKAIPDMSFFVRPILNEKSFNLLFPTISNDVRAVSTRLNDTTWYVIEVISEIDALDYNKSVVDEISKTYIIPRKYCFKSQIVKHHNIFTLTNGRKAYTYVTEEFVKIVNQNHLKGLSFKLVWEEADSIGYVSDNNRQNLFMLETDKGIVNSSTNNYIDAERIINDINNGYTDFLTIKTDNGFLQLFGYDNQFVTEIRINVDGDFATYEIADLSKDSGRDILITPYGEFTPIANRVITKEMVILVVQKLFETSSLERIINTFPCVDTTIETKRHMGLI